MSKKIIIPRKKNEIDFKRFSGKVKFFNPKVGYGKIIQNETFEVFHFHYSNILSNNPEEFRTVKKGKIVEFEIGIHKKYGKFARKITEPGFVLIEKPPKRKLFRNFQEKNPMLRLLCHEEEQQSSNTQ